MSYYTESLVHDVWRKMEDDDYWLRKRPRCDECGEHIQGDTFYNIGGKFYCASCLEGFKEYTDDYIT